MCWNQGIREVLQNGVGFKTDRADVSVLILLGFIQALEVEADPELRHPARNDIPIEWPADVPPFHSFHELEMYGEAQKVCLEAETERTHGLICVTYGHIILVKPEIVEVLGRISLHSRATDIEEERATDRT